MVVGLWCLLASCDPDSPQRHATEAAETLADVLWFTDEASRWGVDFVHQSGADGRYLLPEIMAGGVALLDVDGDGDLDLYLVQSGGLDELGQVVPNDGNILYLNEGDRFIRSTDSGHADQGYGVGVVVGDYDGDSDMDIYVTNVGANVLLRNDGRGRFVDVTKESGVGDDGFGTAGTFFDADNDGDQDLFLVNYIAWGIGIERQCHDYGTGVRNYCDPGNYDAPAQDRLYRNNGDGTFSDITRRAGLTSVTGNGLGTVSADFNGDGLLDLFVANDKTMNQLWINQGDLRFEDRAVEWGSATDDHGIAKAGMGIVTGDVDNDADLDVLVVNIEGETDSYFRNEGDYFVDATARVGLGSTSRRYTRFGVVLADLDNDGVLDLYEANGRVTYTPEPEDPADVYAEPNVLYRGQEMDLGIRFGVLPQGGLDQDVYQTSRGLALGDLNGDGSLDLIIANRDSRPNVLINQQREHEWVRVVAVDDRGIVPHALISGRPNGSERVLTRQVQMAGSYVAAHEPAAHFGLGSATGLVDVVVLWPDGEREAFGDLQSRGGVLQLVRGLGARVH